MNSSPLYILDGYSLIYKSYFAFIRAPLYNRKNENTSALFGFFRTLFSFIESYSPEYFAVAMDSIGPTFRHEKYSEYKATRDKTPEDLHAQIPRIEKILEAAGIKIVRVNGFEADDIIATYASKCTEQKRKCVIITGDKDLMQLVSEYTAVLKPDKNSYEEIRREEVFAHYGVYPEQITDYLALTGDTADNIPGVKGIGPKNAAALLSKYSTLEGIYENIDKISGSVKGKLEEGKENCFMSRDLVILESGVPSVDDVESFLIEPLSLEKTIPLFEEENAKSLASWAAEKSGIAGGGGNSSTVSRGEAADAAGGGKNSGTAGGGGPEGFSRDTTAPEKELSVFFSEKEISALKGKGSYSAVTDIASLDRVISEVRKNRVFAFDIETDSLDTLAENPGGFSIPTAAVSG